MGVSVSKFLENVEAIYESQPSYEHGHDGSDGSCDCIGLVKGALRKSGVEPKGLKGTNYAQRYTIKNQYSVGDGSKCKLGDVVLKYKEPGESGYDLPEAYQQGGSSYNGDLRDYYHIGVVTGVNPLVITHMTSPSAKKDTKVGQWKIGGEVPQVDYGSEPGPEPTPEPPEPTPTTLYAEVYAESGKTVNIRKRASTDSPLVERVPIGDTVEVTEKGDEWCKVSYRDNKRATWRGYMMTKFLIFQEEPDDPGDLPTGYTVTIPGLTKEEADALVAQYPDAYIGVG